jgi:hypothetical protein
MLITADNPSLEQAEKTILTDPVSVGDTTINVKSSQGYTNTYPIIIGEPGNEKTEIKKINAAISSDTQLGVVATEFSHTEGDPVYEARYNQVKFYMSATVGGTYVLQTTVEIDVDNANGVTVWDDTDGVSTNYYKISYYNDVTTLESSLSNPIPGGGIGRTSVRYITDSVLKEAQDENEAITDRDEILDWMNECQEDVKNRRRKWAFLYKRAVSSRVADRGYYTLATDFGVSDVDVIDHIDYNFNDGSTTDITYRLRYVPKEEFDYQTEDNDAETSDSTAIWTYDEATDYLWVNPVPDTAQAAAFYLYYYKNFTELNSDGDAVEIPDPAVYKSYCLYRFFNKKGDQAKIGLYMNDYERRVSSLARRQRKEVGQPVGFKYVPGAERRYYKY